MSDPTWEGPTGEDLLLRLDMIVIAWQAGASALAKWGGKYTIPTGREIIEVLPDVRKDIDEHRRTYNIRVNNYDINKLVNYLAWHLGKSHDTAALFYGYLLFIDDTIRGSTLKSIPDIPLICENLKRFHQNGHKLTPYGVIKGIDLAFTHCCGAQELASWKTAPAPPERTVFPPPPKTPPEI